MSDVIIRKEGRVGRIILNRPKALHALTRDMCAAIINAIVGWEKDNETVLALIDHGEGRGFCAGGDIRWLAGKIKTDRAAVRGFFFTEYRMNHLVFTSPLPVVSFLDGIVMGGGAGLALPCRYRVGTQNTRFAMPEAGIGLFPDVGGGWYLSRLRSRIGQWLALTGAKLDGAECRALGLVTHYIEGASLPALKARLIAQPDEVSNILDAFQSNLPAANFAEHEAQIARCFATATLGEIIAELELDGSAWALAQTNEIKKKSPRCCAVALRQLEAGAKLTDFTDVMRMEYRIASRIIFEPDFAEGVRAFMLDKDNAPVWTSIKMDDDLFADLPRLEEWSPLERTS